jgi:cold shock CspA family protein
MEGKISVWISSRNFGFVVTDTERFFMHRSKIKSGTPIVGRKVEFDVNPIIEGPTRAAINVIVEEGAI